MTLLPWKVHVISTVYKIATTDKSAFMDIKAVNRDLLTILFYFN